ncbi:MAG TPA: serine/threonine-protein kinase [Planctomycetota bacterium]|jgi:predicted Ser/Thr protein kinase
MPKPAEAEQASVETPSPKPTSTVCSLCLQKLQSNGRPDRTTMFRPIAELNIVEEGKGGKTSRKVIIGPDAPPPHEPALVIGSDPAPKTPSKKMAPSDAADTIGRLFGSYEILSEISRGSFGVVYKAKQQGLDRIAALKVLLAGTHAAPEAVARFQREAKAVARLKHPNIVPVYDIGTQDGHHYFAMEFVEGQALSQRVAKHDITISDSLHIAEALADALECAHQAGVIHRDIKPSNIIVDPKGEPHITDFGLAKQIDSDEKYTLSGTTLGTPAYMPPEQARGEIDKIDARSDVYAVGAVLYEMLTGQAPFAGRSVLQVVVAVINERVQPPRQLNPKIHRDVQTIVMKCLEKDPRLRYASAADLRDDLRRFRSGENIKARPAGIARLTGRFLARHYRKIAVAIVFAAALAALVKTKQEQQLTEKENKELQKVIVAKATAEAAWRPDWWFPPLSPAEMAALEKVSEENAKLHRVPEGKEALFRGWFPGKGGLELKTISTRPKPDQPARIEDHTEKVSGANMLVSPEDLRFYGDVEADIKLRLPDFDPKQSPAPRLRVGIQSIGTAKPGLDGIPFLVEFSSGTVRIIGPVDMYAHTNPSDGERHGIPKLEVKAEKVAPSFVKGDYVLNLHREGTHLAFRLTQSECKDGIPYPGCSIEIKDSNLSNWIFKNTQLVVRDLPDPKWAFSAEVRRKYGDDDPDRAFSFFRVGDYNVAEAELKVLASGPDAFKRARARYQLGLIQEICGTSGRELTLYTDALSDLEQMQPADLHFAEREKLARELHMRKLVRFAKIKQWNGVLDELNEGWSGGLSIGEPLAWELHPVLEMLFREKEPEPAIKILTATAIFQRLGLPPGSSKFGQCAEALAALLIAERRFDDLVALHKVYPSQALFDELLSASRKVLESENKDKFEQSLQLLSYIAPFCRGDKDAALFSQTGCDMLTACLKSRPAHYVEAAKVFALVPSLPALKVICAETESQAKDLATDAEFHSFTSKLLAPVLARFPQDPAAPKLLENALDKLCDEIIAGAKLTKLLKLHETLRGPLKFDTRLANAFVKALQKLAATGDAASAQALLQYCSLHVAKSDPEIRRAVFALAKKAAADGDLACTALMKLQRWYPTPELISLVGEEMLALNHPQRMQYDAAVTLFSRARVEFGEKARVLTPLVLGALEKVRSVENRQQLLKTVWLLVTGQLEECYSAATEGSPEQAAIAASDRQWRIEYGDIQLAMNQWDDARRTYRLVYEPPTPATWSLKTVEPELRARAALRLGAIAMAKVGNGSTSEILLPLLSVENLQDEYKLAARFLAAPDQITAAALDAQLQTLRAPLLLADSEWELLRGLRLRADGQMTAAGNVFRSAETKSSSARTWVLPIASLLGRSSGRSPEEEARSDAEQTPAPNLNFPKPPVPTKN